MTTETIIRYTCNECGRVGEVKTPKGKSPFTGFKSVGDNEHLCSWCLKHRESK